MYIINMEPCPSHSNKSGDGVQNYSFLHVDRSGPSSA